MKRRFSKNIFFTFIITILIIGLGNSVIISAKDNSIRDKLLGNIKALKEGIRDLEKIVAENRLGDLGEKIEQIKGELDNMAKERNIKQVEKELDRAAEQAKQKRIGETERRLDEKTRKEKERKGP